MFQCVIAVIIVLFLIDIIANVFIYCVLRFLEWTGDLSDSYNNSKRREYLRSLSKAERRQAIGEEIEKKWREQGKRIVIKGR